jgi:hypothetical protein
VSDPMQKFVMPDDAYALRPVRFMRNEQLKYYSAVTFPENPRAGCDIYRRRCDITGGIAAGQDDATGICDILNERDDIVADFWLNDKGLKFLYSKLNLRVDTEA